MGRLLRACALPLALVGTASAACGSQQRVVAANSLPAAPSIANDVLPLVPSGSINALSLAAAAVDDGFVVTWATESSADRTLFVQALDRAGRPIGPAQVAGTLNNQDGIYASITRCGPQSVLRYRLLQRGAFLDAHGAVASTFPSFPSSSPSCDGTASAPPRDGTTTSPATFAVQFLDVVDGWQAHWKQHLGEKRPQVSNTGDRSTWTLPVPWRDPPLMFARAGSTYLLVWTTSKPRTWRDPWVPPPVAARPPGPEKSRMEKLLEEARERKKLGHRSQPPPEVATAYGRTIVARVTEAGDVLEPRNGALEVGDGVGAETLLAAADDAFLLVWRAKGQSHAARIDAATGAVSDSTALGPTVDALPTSAASDGKDFAVAFREPTRVTMRYPIDGPLRTIHAEVGGKGVFRPTLACAAGRCLIVYLHGSGADAQVMSTVVTAAR